MKPGVMLLAVLAAVWNTAVAAETSTLFATNAPGWRYFKGTNEASLPDWTAWRNREFADGDWPAGPAPFFYGETYLTPGTTFDDMPGRYTTVYLRRAFTITNAVAIDSLELTAACDDGFIAWINGTQVAAYNAPTVEPRFDAVASVSATEPAPFYGYPILDPAPFLVSGTNLLAIQVFNVSSGSSDLVFDAALVATLKDLSAPLILAVSPAPGLALTNLTQLTVTFSEPVTGVDAADLLLNDFPCTTVTGGPTVFTFTFAQPDYGVIQAYWRMDHGITDLATPPNSFNPAAPGSRWFFDLNDPSAPILTALNPPKGATVRQLTRIEAVFDRAVEGVDATDLLVGGQAATSVTGTAAGPYVFEFPAAATGVVQLAWAPDHAIQDFAAAPHRFDGGPWSYTVNPLLAVPALTVNEFMAENTSGIQDEDGDREDWIEIYNPGNSTVNLEGWALTDDPAQPGQWVFPAVSLGARQYLVVFASAKDRRPTGSGKMLHTNFKLGIDGEYLGLYNAEAPRVAVSEIAPAYPEQRVDYSYGRDPQGHWRYYAGGTPRTANTYGTILGALDPVHFSVTRGFFQKPFNLTLAAATGATIRYTTNGSVPTLTNGWVYTQPIAIATTRVIRAAAFRDSTLPSKVTTHSYLYNVAAVRRLLPSLSLVTASNCLYGASGIMEYNPRNTLNHGLAWERPVSAEWIRPEDNGGFQADCGLRIQGGGYIRGIYNYRSGSLPDSKYSFRLYLRGDYGPGRLEYPLFPEVPIDSFDTVVLRAGMNDCLNPYLRDEMARRLEADVGQVAARGTWCNLYLNGVYKGYYNPTQRIDTDFLKDAHGSTNDWDLIAMGGEVREGDTVAWTAMRNYASTNDLSLRDRYLEMERRLDLTNFVEYLLPLIYADCDDWPHNNWRAARERKTGALYRFYAWDAEWTFGLNGSISRNTIANQLSSTTPPWGGTEIQTLFLRLKAAPEFRLLFADRIHKHFFNGGNLTDDKIKTRYEWLKAQIAPTIGGSFDNTIGSTWIPGRRRYLTNHFQLAGLLASSNAPILSQFGGAVPSGFALTLSNGTGTIYYTTNGSDPRVRFTGTVAPDARAWVPGQPIVLDRTTLIRARTQWSTNWSAVTEATFTVEDFGLPLRIVEIMYNPPGGDAFEFIELENQSPVAIDLSGVHFEGIDFYFPQGVVIAGGARLVLTSNNNPAAFAQRYPGVAVYGRYGGVLSNKGERLALLDRANRVVQSVDYRDDQGWPKAADGDGYSLESVRPDGDPDDPANWVASIQPGGSPGTPNPLPNLPTIRLNEIAISEPGSGGGTNLTGFDWCEIHNAGTVDQLLLEWTLSDAGGTRRFMFPRVTVPAGGFLVLVCATNAPPGYLHTGFRLESEADDLFLCDALGRRVDALGFGPQVPGWSLGRLGPNAGWGLTEPTPGTANSSAVPLASAASVGINEVLANALPGGEDWIELYNRDTNRPAGLAGLALATTNALFRISATGFIAPGGHVLLHADEKPGAAHLDFKLPAAGSAVVLYDPLGREITRLNYVNAAEGTSYGRLPDGASNLVAFPYSSSPGAANFAADYSGARLNEILVRNITRAPNGAGHHAGWVELFNSNTNAFDLGGFSLSFGDPIPGQWMFPPGVVLEPQACRIVWADSSVPASTTAQSELNCGLDLATNGGGVYLFNRAGQQVDAVSYGFQIADLSVGRSSAGWGLLALPTPGVANSLPAGLGNPTALRLNEWRAEGGDDDWVELYNLDPLPVNLAGLVLTDDPSIAGQTNGVLGALTFIPGNGWLRFLADATASRRPGHLPFRLDGLGETLRLYSSNFTVLDNVDLLPQDYGVSEGRFPDGGTQILRFPLSPSPGSANYLPLDSLVVNEVLTAAPPPLEPAIELSNRTARNLSAGGFWLSDDPDRPRKFLLPETLVVPAHGELVLYANEFAAAGAASPLVLDPMSGGCLVLSECDTNGALTGYRSVATFGAADPGVSFGRIDTSQGPDFAATVRTTFGADNAATVTEFRTGLGLPNAPPRVGPLIINELMYAPPAVTAATTLSPEHAEFIELFQAGDGPVALFDPDNPVRTWCLAGAVNFVFPPQFTLLPGAYAVVVAFDPVADPATLESFRARYNLDQTVRILGPWSGRLADEGETVRLEKPRTGGTAPDGGPYVAVESIRYAPRVPWPPAAAGTGMSLQRLAPLEYGNEPLHWHAAWPSPGRPNAPGQPDADNDGLPDDWELVQGLSPAIATGEDGPDGDPDGDGLSNRIERTLGTTARTQDFVITAIALDATGVRLGFNAVPGRTYAVEYRDAFDGTAWKLVTNFLPPSTPQIVQVRNVPPPGLVARYYRIRTL